MNSFNVNLFTDETKKICTCSALAIIIIVLFVITPLSNFFKTSLFMKLISLILLGYTLYLNNTQTNLLRSVNSSSNSAQVNSQINTNIICSYVFSLFIGLLIIFIIKSFFNYFH
jgi:hypothetical protein